MNKSVDRKIALRLHAIAVPLIVSIILLAVPAFSQYGSEYAVPVKWDKYRVPQHSISVEFPKLPVADASYNDCEGVQMEDYLAYAERTVYRMTIVSKRKGRDVRHCYRRSDFGAGIFRQRLRELAGRGEVSEESRTYSERELATYTFPSGNSQYRVISDLTNDKWVEMSVTRRSLDTKKAERFFESLAFVDQKGAIEIRGGAVRTLGDRGTVTAGAGEGPLESGDYLLLFKPKARYTDVARNSDTQGTVRLKVVLLHNGGVGTITPVKELPYGLTEQAIIAAQRLVFIPKVADGKGVSVMVTVDYSFSIY